MSQTRAGIIFLHERSSGYDWVDSRIRREHIDPKVHHVNTRQDESTRTSLGSNIPCPPGALSLFVTRPQVSVRIEDSGQIAKENFLCLLSFFLAGSTIGAGLKLEYQGSVPETRLYFGRQQNLDWSSFSGLPRLTGLVLLKKKLERQRSQ